MVTASSDWSIKLWDIGERRCIKTYYIHRDSVWSLAVDHTFTQLFSGGRDGSVFVTDLSSAESSLLIDREEPVLRIRLAADESSLWLSTPVDGNVYKYAFGSSFKSRKALEAPEFCSSPGSPAMQNMAISPSSPSSPLWANQSEDEDEDGEVLDALLSHPALVITGRAGIVRHHILNDRVRILTQDSEERILLWDVLKAQLLEDLGVRDWEETINQFFQLISIPQWFRVDHSTGVSKLYTTSSF